jgi:hypothetical protein
MPVTSGQLTVSQTALQIDGSSAQGWRLHIHNNSATTALYVGGDSSVSSSTGLQLQAQDNMELELNPGDMLWVVSTTNNHPVSWMKITQD